MIQLPHTEIDPQDVESCTIEVREYINAGVKALNIKMKDKDGVKGARYFVRHEPHIYGGFDIYKLKEAIEDGR